jgi:hypothetical protein
MYFAVIDVKAMNDFHLILTFDNGEKRRFDMNPYLEKGLFHELKDISEFKKVRVSFDTIEWENEADFDPEVLYDQSVQIAN